MTFSVNLRKRILFLVFACLIGYFITSVAALLFIMKFGQDSTPAMRIVAMLQDIFVFIAPALATAIIVTKQPAELLAVNVKPDIAFTIMATCTLIASIPVMNFIVQCNESLPLPDSLREMENNAAAMVQTMMGTHTVANLILTVLIMGVFTGFSEELLFRGALQRMFSTGGINPHAAIWMSAVIFSAVHMQFFGFVPRMLLGAFLGYALYWSSSLWLAIILHALNNTIYVVHEWLGDTLSLDLLSGSGIGAHWLTVLSSLLLTAAGLCIMHKMRR